MGPENRDTPCFAFKGLEEKGHGFKSIDWITLEQIIRTVSASGDDTNM